jgi:ABC-type sugar transport system permease subunit
MTPPSPTVPPPGSTARRWPSILLGLFLLLPAAVCCGTTLLGPTVQTIVLSQQKSNGISPVQGVGGANFIALARSPTTLRAVSFTVDIILVRLLAVVIVPVLLALAAGALGRWAGGGLRLLFTLPLVLFAPTGLAVARVLARTPGNNALISPAGAQGTLLFIDGAQTLALACGVGLITYLAALRAGAGSSGWRTVRGPLLLVWIVSALAALASGLQTFNLPYVLTNGGPAAATTTVMLYEFQFAFRLLQFGPAAALATLILAPLVVMGLLAGVLLVVSGARFEHAPANGAAYPRMPALLAIALLVVLGLAAFGLWASSQLPWLQAAALALRGEARPAIQVAPGNSLVGPAAVLSLQLPLAYLAALGISALRPLGRRSEWLLLPFSPWLFVTLGPLSVAEFVSALKGGRLNTGVALASPLLLSVPMLFALALFFRGRVGPWRAARAAGRSALGAFFGEVVIPSLPFALLLAVIGMLVSDQELLWPLLAANRPELATGNVVLVQQLSRLAGTNAALARALWSVELPGFVFGLVALGLLQVLYVGRLALRTGREDEPVAKA